MTVAFEPIVRITSPNETLIKVEYPQVYTGGATLRHSKYFNDKKDAVDFANGLRGPNGEEMEIFDNTQATEDSLNEN